MIRSGGGMRPQRFRRQRFERQSLDRGREPAVVLVDGDIDGDGLFRAVSRLPAHAMHPNFPGTDPGAAEALDADRQIGAARPVGGLREIAIGVDQRRIEMQAGIEQGGMQPRSAVEERPAAAAERASALRRAPTQQLDGAKRRAVLQSEGAQRFVVAVDRDRTGAPRPDEIEVERAVGGFSRQPLRATPTMCVRHGSAASKPMLAKRNSAVDSSSGVRMDCTIRSPSSGRTIASRYCRLAISMASEPKCRRAASRRAVRPAVVGSTGMP